MGIPKNITKANLLAAISKIDKEGIPKDANSQYYDVVYSGKNYPPKLVVSFSNLFANGEVLDRKLFSGGLDTECFKLLEQNDFIIKPKDTKDYMSYFEEINRFLEQAHTNELGTLSYLNNYQGLKVKVSFGKGNVARIPWIAFLKETQTVQDGIYPVYLFYKEKNLLILAYGLSETNRPITSWNLTDSKSIKKYFEENMLGVPERYGSSLIYKIYKTDLPLKENEINVDLNNIIDTYNQTLLQGPILNSITITDQAINESFDHKQFIKIAKESGLSISTNLCVRFIASLLTKPFVILTGLSGSGKTKLAQTFATWICESKTQYCIVPVGADWTNREPLLGFPNALRDKGYIKPDNRVLDLIIEANKSSEKPYFLILDEMNLSHVERYFADFLSIMESKHKLSLHPGNETWNDVPAEISFPENLFIIGTVNIDETTYMFSPKVLDRANVIEFSVSKEAMGNYLENGSIINLKNLEGVGATMADGFVEIAKDYTLILKDTGKVKDALLDFFTGLKKIGAEFGYRSASEILRFAAVISKIEKAWSVDEIIDAAIVQKLLPKVHGSRRKLEPVLKILGELCLLDGQTFDNFLSPKKEIDFPNGSKIKYPVSLEKILRMYNNLLSNGFTSYAEA